MLSPVFVIADTKAVDETNLNALREELASLEAAEARVSAERSRLHQQIDFGYSASELLKRREREVSAERRELHRRIDSLQDRLGIERTSAALARKRASARELGPGVELERPEHLIA
jgi:septal ring factor EnvC (AmiA/AmiB activator)